MDGNNNNLQLYSLSQAAKMLGIGRDTLNDLITRGKIGVIKIIKRNKISHIELEKFIAENTRRDEKPRLEVDAKSFLEKSFGKKKINTQTIFDSMIKDIN